MLNGKFFTGLPPKMIDRSVGQNRQQSHFFWPDDSNSESVVDSRLKRRNSVQAGSRDEYQQKQKGSVALAKPSNDVETKQMFEKEFSKSSIQFYDVVNEEQPNGQWKSGNNRNAANNRQENGKQQQNIGIYSPSNLQASAEADINRKTYNSKIEFYDFPDGGDLNNSRSSGALLQTDKNVKREVDRNSKNSPKLQNKAALCSSSIDSEDQRNGIRIIENDVRSMNIHGSGIRQKVPIKNHLLGDNYYDREYSLPEPVGGARYVDAYDMIPARRVPNARRVMADPFYEDYSWKAYGSPNIARRDPRSAPRTIYHNGRDGNFSDDSARRNFRYASPPLRYSDHEIDHANTGTAKEFHHRRSEMFMTPPKDLHLNSNSNNNDSSKNNSKVENTNYNTAEHAPSPIESASRRSLSAAKHLRSNICLSDSDSAQTTTSTPPLSSRPRRNIRSTAVNRVSVGLPD